ncbi:O-antigen ligase family protein [Kerstersia sp.]|uniref:O-antigen ligase family protein n=1 Tax=Kerstersia sp. TaxID=1930783 RepID=UPI003F9212C7
MARSDAKGSRVWLNWERWVVATIAAVSLSFSQIRVNGLFNTGERIVVDSQQGSMLNQLVYGGCLALAFLVAWRHQRAVWLALQRIGWMLPLFLLCCAASVFWSAYPLITAKRVVQISGWLLIGLLLTLPGFGTPFFSRVLRVSLGILIVLSAMMAILTPQYGQSLDIHGGAWHGILWQKNTLGAAAAAMVLFWFDAAYTQARISPWLWLGTALGFVTLVMTKSSTSLLTLLLALGIYLMVYRARILQYRMTAVLVCAGCVGVLLGLHFYMTVTGELPSWKTLTGPVTASVGKGNDLTGRTEIWALLFEAIKSHPWLGIGYGAFWIGENGPAQFIADFLYWMPSHGHNGFLDMLNELGIVGFALLVLVCISHVYKLIHLSRYAAQEAALHLAVFVMLVISNFSESHLLYGLSFQNCLFIFSIAIVSNSLARHRNGGFEARPYQ